MHRHLKLTLIRTITAASVALLAAATTLGQPSAISASGNGGATTDTYHDFSFSKWGWTVGSNRDPVIVNYDAASGAWVKHLMPPELDFGFDNKSNSFGNRTNGLSGLNFNLTLTEYLQVGDNSPNWTDWHETLSGSWASLLQWNDVEVKITPPIGPANDDADWDIDDGTVNIDFANPLTPGTLVKLTKTLAFSGFPGFGLQSNGWQEDGQSGLLVTEYPTITAVPLPAVAWSGLLLLGYVGLRRKRSAA